MEHIIIILLTKYIIYFPFYYELINKIRLLNKNLREIINKNLWLQKIPSQYIENYLEKINNKDINISYH